jgi:hypothetical protein
MRTDTAGCFTALAGAFALAGVVACSSASTAPAGGDGGSTSVGAGTNVNPDGVAYPNPAGGYGHTPRSGTTPGSVIQNFKFLGRLVGSSEVTTISLADYYDPCNKRYKILHLSVAAVWCEPCSEETTAIVADLASPSSVLNADKIVFIQALDDGPTQGTPATVSDLNYWIQSHGSNFTEMLDPGLANLGGFFPASAIPWNSDIDVRTMEMLDSNEGWAGDVQTEVASGLAALPATPSYPIPASAGCTQ